MVNRKDAIGKLQPTRLISGDYALRADPFFWKSKAEELHCASLFLANKFTSDVKALEHNARLYEEKKITDKPNPPKLIFNQFFLLSSFALENLFKGLVIYKEPNLISGGKTKGILRSHDLLSLAARADVPLNEEERRFCILASSAAVYWGRYPVSNSADTHISSLALGELAIPTYEQLFVRIIALYPERFRSRTQALPPGP
jgi:hypothetical protein